MCILPNQAASASLLGASMTQKTIPSARLRKLRYGLTTVSARAALAICSTCSRFIAPAGRLWQLMNFGMAGPLRLLGGEPSGGPDPEAHLAGPVAQAVSSPAIKPRIRDNQRQLFFPSCGASLAAPRRRPRQGCKTLAEAPGWGRQGRGTLAACTHGVGPLSPVTTTQARSGRPGPS